MSLQDNKILVRRFIDEVYNQGNLAAVDELFSPDFQIPDALPAVPPGTAGIKHHVRAWRAAFPDMRVTIDDLIAEGDKVVYRWTVQGTHQGEFMGAPATGEPVRVSGIVILRVADGHFLEMWQSYDRTGFLQRLGVAR